MGRPGFSLRRKEAKGRRPCAQATVGRYQRFLAFVRHYGEMPSLKAEHLVQGDLDPNMDFRSVYSTILDKWLKLNPAPIVNGTYEQPAFLN